MRCFFLSGGHIAAVEILDAKSDGDAIAQSLALFHERQRMRNLTVFDGFEVWDRTRFLYRHPTPISN